MYMYYNTGWPGARNSSGWPGNITCTIIQGGGPGARNSPGGPGTSHVLQYRGGGPGARTSPGLPGNITCTIIQGGQVPGIRLVARKHHMYYNTGWPGVRNFPGWPGNITFSVEVRIFVLYPGLFLLQICQLSSVLRHLSAILGLELALGMPNCDSKFLL